MHSADELLVTELLFNGVFNDLTPEQCCALLSCFVFQDKSQRYPRLTEQLSGPLRLLQVGENKLIILPSNQSLISIKIFHETKFGLSLYVLYKHPMGCEAPLA